MYEFNEDSGESSDQFNNSNLNSYSEAEQNPNFRPTQEPEYEYFVQKTEKVLMVELSLNKL